jgi:ParB-like chromosome segregation protein Spo0J
MIPKKEALLLRWMLKTKTGFKDLAEKMGMTPRALGSMLARGNPREPNKSKLENVTGIKDDA